MNNVYFSLIATSIILFIIFYMFLNNFKNISKKSSRTLRFSPLMGSILITSIMSAMINTAMYLINMEKKGLKLPNGKSPDMLTVLVILGGGTLFILVINKVLIKKDNEQIKPKDNKGIKYYIFERPASTLFKVTKLPVEFFSFKPPTEEDLLEEKKQAEEMPRYYIQFLHMFIFNINFTILFLIEVCILFPENNLINKSFNDLYTLFEFLVAYLAVFFVVMLFLGFYMQIVRDFFIKMLPKNEYLQYLILLLGFYSPVGLLMLKFI
jgi:hypothetical protein